MAERTADHFAGGGRLIQNTSALVIGRLGVAALGWLGTVLIARQLGAEEFGQFTLVFSLLGMLSIVSDLGIGRVIIAALLSSDGGSERVAGTYVILRTVLGAAAYVVVVAFVMLGGYPQQVLHATAIAGLVVLLATPSHAYDIAFQLEDRLGAIAISAVFGQLAQVALTIALVLRGGSVVWFVVPAILNEVVVLAWKAPAAHRLIDFEYCIDWHRWTALIKEAVPLSAGAAFVTVYYRLDSVMLSKLDTFGAVGTYGVAYKFVDLVHFVPSAIGVALIAPLAAAWTDSMADFHRRCINAFRLLATFGGAAAVGFWLFGSETAEFLYGSEYRDAGQPVSVLVTAEVLAFGSTIAITALVAAARHRRYPFITLAGLVLNVVLNLILIPTYSTEGAALATLATELVVLILVWRVFATTPQYDSGPYVSVLGRIAPAVIAATLTGLAAEQFLHWIVAAALAMLSYGVVVFASRREV